MSKVDGVHVFLFARPRAQTVRYFGGTLWKVSRSSLDVFGIIYPSTLISDARCSVNNWHRSGVLVFFFFVFVLLFVFILVICLSLFFLLVVVVLTSFIFSLAAFRRLWN